MKSRIKKMIEMRKRMGIHSTSAVKVLKVKPKQYVADIKGRHGVVRVKLGPERDMGEHKPDADDGWKQLQKGHDYCLWEKASA